MKITELLRKQHEEAKTLIDRLENCGVDERSGLTGQVSRALRAHAQTEEEIFYPKLEHVAETAELIEESFEDHDELRLALGELERTEVDDDDFLDRVQTVEDLVMSHVEEEENELFPKVEELWNVHLLETVGREYETRFHELEAGQEVRT